MTDLLQLKEYCQSMSILYIEDEINISESVVRYLSKIFGDVKAAYDGEEGLACYSGGTFDIVMTDINMPKMNGIELARRIKAINSDQMVIIASAHSDTGSLLESIHMGLSAYILKPIDFEQMNSVLYKVASIVKMRKENKLFHEDLYQLVKQQTQSLTDNYELTIKAMVDVVESRDTYTGGHSERVAQYAKAIANEMNLSDEECELVFRAGMVHDIGKVTTPDSILLKPGKLSQREHNLIQNHVVESYKLLSKIPMYDKLAQVVRSHHERYDGQGYPNGLSGQEIPLLSRVMIIADAFDAMTTNRIYKGRMNLSEAVVQIKEGSGTQFDPEVVPFACAALSKMSLDESVNQLPQNSMEEERFAYFYHDAVTECYNKAYLILFLQNMPKDTPYRAGAFFLKNFSQYNKLYGWEDGDVLLQKFTRYLEQKYPDVMIFRVHGDDFILLSKNSICELQDRSDQPSFFEDTGVHMKCYSVNIGDNFMENLKRLDNL